MANSTGKGGWKAGQSGNPRGRPAKWANVQGLRDELAKHMPAIMKKLVAAAKGGDVQAIRLILERVLPPMKAVEPAQVLNIDTKGSLTDQGNAIMAAVVGGELAPGQGAQLLAALGHLGKAKEIDEIERRIAALEARHGNKT